MKVGDLIKVIAEDPWAGGYKIPNGQLGVLIEESTLPNSIKVGDEKQWKVLISGAVYWLYPGELELVE
jgi:hypothetical protein